MKKKLMILLCGAACSIILAGCSESTQNTAEPVEVLTEVLTEEADILVEDENTISIETEAEEEMIVAEEEAAEILENTDGGMEEDEEIIVVE